ncbi:hypothetical protein [Nocardia pseudovaccinii]|uniref:hypothetical protein n=1 Tax=Nocardia pseudovaccinii TaxID=189540 RepID=UPI0007A38692|nr:hypothetical protein [Nocardia pseudovaccinii]
MKLGGKVLWGLVLVALPVLVVAGLLVFGIGKPWQARLEQDRELSTRLNELWHSGGTASLGELAGGDWDRVHIYQQEVLGRDQVEREVGAPVPMEDTFDRRGASVLVFMKGVELQRAVWVDVPLLSGVYTAAVTLTAPGYPKYLEFNEPEPTGPHLVADTELEAKLRELVRTRGTSLLRDLTGGDWDRVYILTANTRARVEEFVGAPVEMEPVFTHQGSILVFRDGDAVQRASFIPGFLPQGIYSSAVRVDATAGMPKNPTLSDPTPPK